MPSLRRKLITDAVVARAGTVNDLQVFRAEINQPLNVLPDTDRVSRYVVIYPFGGAVGPDADLGDVAVDLTYTFQATVAAGFAADCEFLVDQVDAVFYRWVPAVSGLVFGAFRPPPGYDPGPVRRDETVNPPRFWVPLQYRTVATAT